MCISVWRHYWPVRRCQSRSPTCQMILIWLTLRYHFTGRFWDILRDLAEAGSFPESHASQSGNNNKRVYGSDEPADSPSPDDTSKVSQNRRGPIAGSKRVSSSLHSSRGGVIPLVNDTNVSSPTSTTSGTQDTQRDLGILPVTGSASTPERTDGLGTSDSSPGTLTKIFDGDTIPITTNDLGRLPLHHGVKFPTNFDFEAIANGWNTSGQASTTLGMRPNLGLSQGAGVNSRGTQAGVIPGLHLPQEQHPEDLFPWMSYNMAGAGETTTGTVPDLATIATTTRQNVGSTYVTTDPDQAQQAADQLDSAILSLFGDVPSTSSTALGQTEGLLSEPASNTAEDDANLFGALFPSLDPPVGTNPSTTVQEIQQPHSGHQEQVYESLPVDPQGYLHGWSSAPQAFE